MRIHLDHVEGIGDFVELEGVADAGSDLARERAVVERLRVSLGIDDDAILAAGYADLVAAAAAPHADELLRAAEAAMRRAHAPYSDFPVGAALRTPDGTVFAGANVENAAYPQGQCAEASAIGALVSGGGREIAEVAVVAGRMDICPPCGGCRQRLSELAGPGTPGAPRPARRPAADAHAGRAAAARLRRGSARMSAQARARAEAAGAALLDRTGEPPRVGLVLGSGLGSVADAVEDATAVGYDELPGFPRPGVEGHAGRAVLGRLAGVPIAVLQGRAHLYEGDTDGVRTPVRALRAAGAEIVVLTNAAGSLRPDLRPGPPDGDRRPHQPDRAATRSSAPTTTRSARASPAWATPTTPACAPRCTPPPTSRASRWPRASTSA